MLKALKHSNRLASNGFFLFKRHSFVYYFLSANYENILFISFANKLYFFASNEGNCAGFLGLQCYKGGNKVDMSFCLEKTDLRMPNQVRKYKNIIEAFLNTPNE